MTYLKRIAFIILLSFAVLEVGLTHTDPLGLYSRSQMGITLQARAVGEGVYQLAAGHYDYGTWSATVNADLTRRVPDTGVGCNVVVFGDSVAWGWAVNDDETLVNQLARHWPDVTLINAGIPGYNSHDVLARVQATTFDAALYLIFDNDPDAPLDFGGNSPTGDYVYPGFNLIPGGMSVLWAYIAYGAPFVFHWLPPNNREMPGPERFWNDMDMLSAVDNLTLIAFDTVNGRAIVEHYPVALIPMYSGRISWSDDHPSVADHAQIAGAIADTVLMDCAVE